MTIHQENVEVNVRWKLQLALLQHTVANMRNRYAKCD